MRKLVFLAPQEQQVTRVITAFAGLGIDESDIHVVSEDPERVTALKLHPATVLETTELENDMDWGMVAGGRAGLATGLVVTNVLGPTGIILGGGTLVVSSILGIGLGGWLGKLIGEDTPLFLLQKYKDALQQGAFLVMVDIPAERMSEIHKVIRHHCPKALIEIIHLHWDHQQTA